MTHTDAVSARVARLEALVRALPDHYDQEQALLDHLDQVRRRIQEGETARRILPALGAQIDRLLANGALLAEAEAPADTESNSENLPINPAHIAAPDPAPEAEAPTETPEPAAEDLSNSEEVLETKSTEAEPPTAADRVRMWVREQPRDETFTAQAVADALELSVTLCGNYLGRLIKAGDVERVPGTGRTGVPSLYRLPGSLAGVQPPKPAPAPQPVPAPAPAPMPFSVPIPEGLGVDERCAFDCLRKEPDGLTARLLVARLNWSPARTGRALESLTQAGYIGRNGERHRVIPEELRGKAGAA